MIILTVGLDGTPYDRGYNDGFFITCDESTCFEDGSPNNGLPEYALMLNKWIKFPY